MQKLRSIRSSAGNCTDETKPFDVTASFDLMARLRGRGGEADFERCLEMQRAKSALKGEWETKYLLHPSVDVKRRKAYQMLEVAGMPKGRERCSTYSFTIALEFNRFKNLEQCEAFIAEYPPDKFTTAQLHDKISEILGQKRTPRRAAPRSPYNTIVCAAGKLYLDPTDLNVDVLNEHYGLLATAFSTNPALHPFLKQLDEARTLLEGKQRLAGTSPADEGATEAAA